MQIYILVRTKKLVFVSDRLFGVALTDLSALLYASSIVVSLFLPCLNHRLLDGFLLISFASPIGACTTKAVMLTLGSASG